MRIVKRISIWGYLCLGLTFVLAGEQDAVLKLELGSLTNHYTGRMYCELPIKIIIDSPNPTTAIQTYVDFNSGEIGLINNRSGIFWPTNPLLPQTQIPKIIRKNGTGRISTLNNAFNIGQRRSGTNALFGTIFGKSLTGITTSSLGFYVINFSTGQTAGDSTVSREGGGFDLLQATQNLTINLWTGPCLRDDQGPIIDMLNITNNAYRVPLQNIFYRMRDSSNTGFHYEYTTNNYSDVSETNYQPSTTRDNQYGTNSGSINLMISGNTAKHTYNNADPASSRITTGISTRHLQDRGYEVITDPSGFFTFDIEEEIILQISGSDNLGNTSSTQIKFNSPRNPFVWWGAKSDRDGNIGASNPFANALNSRQPNAISLIHPEITTIQFAVVDDWAGINSGTLTVNIRRGAINGPLIKAYANNELSLSGFSVYYRPNNELLGSTGILHNFNYIITLTGFGILPESEQIFVIVQGTDFAGIPFTNTNTNFSDQINFFSFMTRGSCTSLQCSDLTGVIIDMTGGQIFYTGETIVVTGGLDPYISGDILFCGTGYTVFDILASGQTVATGYGGDDLIIVGSGGFTTTLIGNDLTISFLSPSCSLSAIPSTGEVPLTINYTLSGIDTLWTEVQSFDFGSGEGIITGNTGQTTYVHTYNTTGYYLARAHIVNKYDHSKSGYCSTRITAGSLCGDGLLQSPELCDTNNFSGQSCQSFGYTSGNLICSPSCTILTNACYNYTSPPGGGGGPILRRDDCPDGDFSPSYYDLTCEGEEHGASPACPIITSPYNMEVNNAFLRSFSLGITTKCPISSAYLDNRILRKHAAKMITEFAIKIVGLSPDFSKPDCDKFKDISDETDELKNYMKLICQLEIMGLEPDGHTPKKNFEPDRFVDRAQFGTMLSRLIYGDQYNVDEGEKVLRYEKHLKALNRDKIMKMIDNPQMYERRKYVLLMLNRAYENGTIFANRLGIAVKDGLNFGNPQ